MSLLAIQDCYGEKEQHCYGCGAANEKGLQIKSYWQDGSAVGHVTLKPYHIGIPGFAYGGVLASLVDCHGTATAAAACSDANGMGIEKGTLNRFITASLHVDFKKPTPIDAVVEFRGKAIEIKDRKVVVSITVHSGDRLCAEGQVVAVKIPDNWIPK